MKRSIVVQKKDLSIWLNTCRPTEDFAGWWTTDGALWKPLSIRGRGRARPHVVLRHLHDRRAAGAGHSVRGQRFEVFRRSDGMWRWTGGMVSSKETGSPGEQKK